MVLHSCPVFGTCVFILEPALSSKMLFTMHFNIGLKQGTNAILDF